MNGHPDQWISSLDNLHLGKCPMDPAVFGYIRVSQAEGESGLATQRRILTDVASGRNMRRPAWKQ